MPDLELDTLLGGRVALGLAGLATAMLWERTRPFRLQATARFGPGSTNLLLWSGNTAVLHGVFGAAVVATAHVASGRGIGLLPLLSLARPLNLAITVLVLDLATYALHRLYHRSPLLWRVHRVHHSDPELDATTGIRFHPIEVTFSTLVRLAIVAALGADALGVVLFEATLLLTSQLQHADVRLGPSVDAAIRPLLVTPNFHRVHHSVRQEHADSNFGTILSCWDRVFGTYRALPNPEEIVIGAPDLRRGQGLSLLRLLLLPFAQARPRAVLD